jgi:dipeptidyl aminopeptidase/acylaminoacyl peptidase
MLTDKNIEVTDMYSSMFLYDVEKNGMSGFPKDDTIKYMETYPCWSPEGNYLYYCRTIQVKEGYDFKDVKYNLIRRSFDPVSSLFGKAELVFNASEMNKSVSFPSISPDGKSLVFTLHDYGTFSIWHKEADLYLMNLENMEVNGMSLNSNETESWHSWSSNGKWIVFSSKRIDGLTARPYFAYLMSPDSVGKPFVLPQKDPTLYSRMEKTFNRPEFVTGKIKTDPRDFMKASKQDPLKAKWIGNQDK